MEDLLRQIEAADHQGLTYLAVMASLTLPDIASGLESSTGTSNGRLYAEWFDQWLGPEYGAFMSGVDCYKYRCSMLHQGVALPHKGARLQRVVLVEREAPQGHFTHMKMSIIAGEAALQLDATTF